MAPPPPPVRKNPPPPRPVPPILNESYTNPVAPPSPLPKPPYSPQQPQLSNNLNEGEVLPPKPFVYAKIPTLLNNDAPAFNNPLPKPAKADWSQRPPAIYTVSHNIANEQTANNDNARYTSSAVDPTMQPMRPVAVLPPIAQKRPELLENHTVPSPVSSTSPPPIKSAKPRPPIPTPVILPSSETTEDDLMTATAKSRFVPSPHTNFTNSVYAAMPPVLASKPTPIVHTATDTNISSSSASPSSSSLSLIDQAKLPPPRPVQQFRISKARALYDYESRNPNELSLVKDDTIEVFSDHPENNEHWMKADLNGSTGFVPRAYIEVEQSSSHDFSEPETDPFNDNTPKTKPLPIKPLKIPIVSKPAKELGHLYNEDNLSTSSLTPTLSPKLESSLEDVSPSVSSVGFISGGKVKRVAYRAITLKNFESSRADELSLRQDDIVEVIMPGDPLSLVEIENRKGLVPTAILLKLEAPAEKDESRKRSMTSLLRHRSKLKDGVNKTAGILWASKGRTNQDEEYDSSESAGSATSLPNSKKLDNELSNVEPEVQYDVVVAAFAYEANSDQEVSFVAGDTLEVTRGSEQNRWAYATVVSSGLSGWFPTNLVKRPAPTETPNPIEQKPGKPTSGKKTSLFGLLAFEESKQENELPTSLATSLSVFGPKWEAAVGADVAQSHQADRVRHVAIYELFDTWREFETKLSEASLNFIQPLRNSGILSESEQVDLFGNVDEVIQIVQMFLNVLTERIVSQGGYVVNRIGDVLLRSIDQFSSYVIYCGNICHANSMLDRLRQNDAFEHQLQDLNQTWMNLATMISKPSYQIAKLELQIKNIMTATSMLPTHEDLNDLKTAYSRIVNVSTLITCVTQAVQDIVKFDAKTNLWDLSFLLPSRRRLLYVNFVHLLVKKDRLALALLYEDCLVFAYPKDQDRKYLSLRGSQDKLREHYRIREFAPPMFLETFEVHEPEKGESFVIDLVDVRTGERFGVNTLEIINKIKWTQHLLDAKDNLQSKRVLSTVEYFLAPPKSVPHNCVLAESPDNTGFLYVLATDQGLFVRSDSETQWLAFLGARKKVLQVGFAGSMMIVITKDDSTTVVMTFPISVLKMEFMFNEVKGFPFEGTKNAHMFDLTTDVNGRITLSVLTNNAAILYSTASQGVPLSKTCQISVDKPTNVRCWNDAVFVAADRFIRIPLQTSAATSEEMTVPAEVLPVSQPLDVLSLDGILLFCYQYYGLLCDDNDCPNLLSPIYWTTKATSVSYQHPYVFISTQRYIEVRHIDNLHHLIQTMPARNAHLCSGNDGLVIVDSKDGKDRILCHILHVNYFSN